MNTALKLFTYATAAIFCVGLATTVVGSAGMLWSIQ